MELDHKIWHSVSLLYFNNLCRKLVNLAMVGDMPG